MSSLGTGRALMQARQAWDAVCGNPDATESQRRAAWAELRIAHYAHEDYLQSERDEARAERDSE